MQRDLKPEDLSNIVLVSNPSIFPDKSKALFTVTRISLERDRYESSIWLLDLATMEYTPIENGVYDKCPAPAPDGKRYAFISRRTLKEESRGAEIWVSRIGGQPRLITIFDLGVNSFSWSPDSKYLAVVANDGKIEEDVKVIDRIDIWFNAEGYTYSIQRGLYIVDVESGNREKISREDVRVNIAMWSPDGRYIAYTASIDPATPYIHQLYLYDLEKGEHIKIADGITINGIAWSPTSKRIAVIGHKRERGFATHNRLIIYSVSGEELLDTRGRLDRNFLNTINTDVRGPTCSPNLIWGSDDKIYFMISDAGEVYVEAYDPTKDVFETYMRIREGVIDEFSLVDGEIALATAMNPVEPKELYIMRRGSIEKVTSFNSFFIKTHRLSRPTYYRIRASDGAYIDCWILMPGRKDREKIPAILYIHGGPKTMYGWSFIYEFQYLVSRGFALIYSNPRGSDGYSEEFADIRKHYGERDYMDLMEVVDETLKIYSDIDPERLGVTGGSYGGYMTNWIITQTDRFKAAVTQRSISDWISMFGTTDIGHYFVPDQIGCIPWENPDRCLEKSPLRYANKVRTPTLIIHSLEDYRCWVDQAIAFFRALKLNGVKTRLVLFPKENHELSRSGKPRHRVENIKHISGWFEEHLKQ
ncbi:MAG: S9 family peptidase [Sulfolobales archaeon]